MMMLNSESSTDDKKYDVFLSFRGSDTCRTFAGNLYHAFRRERINIFFNDNDTWRRGDEITPFVVKTIQDSRISIVLLSENYASSRSCLDELVAILECKNTSNQHVWPIYYTVHPSDVRHQRGSYEKAMAKFELMNDIDGDRIRQWRQALDQVSNYTGWIIPSDGYEYQCIQKIVDAALQSLPRRYDIFLSFAGEDTRYSFTGHLYHALRQEGLKAFMDDEGLVGGNEISQALLNAIEKSKLSIVVFSENYAYSTWCLDELAKIIECMKTENQLVWPIFYKVEQSDVTNQTNSYGDAMIAHEKRFGEDSEKVKKWRSVLSEVGNLKGEHIKENEHECDFIERIVEKAIGIENDHYHAPLPNVLALEC